MRDPDLLVIKTGGTHERVVREHGDYEHWFIASLQNGASRCEVRSGRGELPDPRRYGGVILTGSPSSVRDEEEWMAKLADWALGADEVGVPVLAVCFGQQLLGERLGGRVERMPTGPERGTTWVELTEEGRRDPLFAGLPQRIRVHQTHEDEVAVPPPGATLLATNEHCRWQAFAAGRAIRAVQFHPEVSAAAMRTLLRAREQPGEVEESEDGKRIMRNWDECFVRAR